MDSTDAKRWACSVKPHLIFSPLFARLYCDVRGLDFEVRVILNPVTMEPKPAITYDFNGVKHIQQGHNFRAINGEEFGVFQVLNELEKQGAWVEVRDLCEAQIQKTPEWLTPYLCAGVAHANLGQVEEAIRRLEHVERVASDNSDYSAATRILKELRNQRPSNMS